MTGSADWSVSNSCWRHGKLLVHRVGGEMPRECLVCGSPQVARVRTEEYTHLPKSNFVTALALVHGTRITVHVPLCRAHASPWKRRLRLNLLVAAIALALAYPASTFLLLPWFLTIPLALMVGIARFAVGANALELRQWDAPYVWLSGVDEAPLGRLPVWGAIPPEPPN